MSEWLNRRQVQALIGGECNQNHIGIALSTTPVRNCGHGCQYEKRSALISMHRWYEKKAESVIGTQYAHHEQRYRELARRCGELLWAMEER